MGQPGRSYVPLLSGTAYAELCPSGKVGRLLDSPHIATAECLSRKVHVKQLLVVLVTASPVTRSVVRSVLEEEGHRVIESPEYSDAASRLSEGLNPDLLLFEPQSGRTSEMSNVRQLTPKLPRDRICLVTGIGDEKLRQEARELGIRHFLTRPITRRDFESIVDCLGQVVEPEISVTSRETTPWWALYTRHQCEKMVAETLACKRFEVFLPLYASIRRWTDRQKTLFLPIFPGYVFVRGGLDRRLEVVMTPGVQTILFYGEQVAAIPESEIHSIRRMVEGPYRVEPHPYLQCGEKVRITRGSLKGIEGVLVRKKNLCRIVLSMDILHQSVAVEVDASDVEPVNLWSSTPGNPSRTTTLLNYRN
jgi:transcription antitermination factor NusG